MLEQKQRVLLVDDEESILFMMGLFLRRAGYFVGDANNGLEALRKFRENSWDLVITDRSLPHMGGEELAQEIRMISSDVPIILTTGFLKSQTRQDLFDEILEKPFSKALLLAAVEGHLTAATQR